MAILIFLLFRTHNIKYLPAPLFPLIIYLMKIFLSFFLIFLAVPTWGKVDPPNYEFSLDVLETFAPTKTKEEIEKKYPTSKIIADNGDTLIKRYEVTHIRYKFPVIVQYQGDKVLDSYARLPSYFLHDVFHQSLINRYGKQDRYQKLEEQAVYQWTNAKNMKITYAGACTITCFPLFISYESRELGEHRSLLEQLRTSLQKEAN